MKATEKKVFETALKMGIPPRAEITGPDDRTREKIAFYSRLGVAELLVVEPAPWSLELYRHNGAELQLVGRSDAQTSSLLEPAKVPLTFRLLPGEPRPQIEVRHAPTARHWRI